MRQIDPATKLRLRREFDVIPIGERAVMVRSPAQGVRVEVEGFTAESLCGVLRGLDGTRTLRDVAGDTADYERLAPLVEGLVEREILKVRNGEEPLSEAARFFAHSHDDPRACWRRLTSSRVTVIGARPLVDAVTQALHAAGVRKVRALRGADATDPEVRATLDARADLAITCVNGARSKLDAVVHARALTERLVWLPVRVFAAEGFVGPLFIPGEGPCHACVATREAANWADPELTRTYLEHVTTRPESLEAYGSLPAFAALAAEWAALEATKYLARFTVPALIGNVLRIDFLGGRTQMHRVLRAPRCASCAPTVRRPGVDGLSYAEPA